MRISSRSLPRTCARLFLPLALAFAGAGCSQFVGRGEDPLAAWVKALPRFPACRDEIDALVDVTRLARERGDNWDIYEPALEAMQEQLSDCLDDSYPNPIQI